MLTIHCTTKEYRSNLRKLEWVWSRKRVDWHGAADPEWFCRLYLAGSITLTY